MSAIISPLKKAFKSIFGRWDEKPQDQQYYVKIFFAIITAIICGFYGLSFAGIRGVMFGFLMYGLSLFVIVYLLEIDPEEIGGRQKLITNSLPSFLLLWVLLWTLLHTFMLPESILEIIRNTVYIPPTTNTTTTITTIFTNTTLTTP